MLKKIKRIALAAVLAITVTAGIVIPVKAADSTLAVTPRFNAANYALLNQQTAVACGLDATAMYNYYMETGVKNGQRIYATLIPTTNENLFKYMSYNRALYVKQGLNPNFQYFNLANYIALNPDLIPIYGSNSALYLYHYINYGIYEGRSSGTVFDPARAIVFNSAIASFNNPKLDPGKIYSNYTATTGLITTAHLSAVSDSTGNLVIKGIAAKPADVQTTTSSNSSSNNNSNSVSSNWRPNCINNGEHDWELVQDNSKQHMQHCKKCGAYGDALSHEYNKVCPYSDDIKCHMLMCECGAHINVPHEGGNGICVLCGGTM